ncbi:MAG: serine hydrolase, partial [Gemmatimonadetes bacterium]|nr:serine hydrolase [Gemmatimonadota bacterium]
MIRIARLALIVGQVLAAPSRAPHGEPAPPERPDAALTARLVSLVRGFGGDVGNYLRHLPTGATVARRADPVFPT